MGTDKGATSDEDQMSALRLHTIRAVHSLAQIIRAQASALQLERRGEVDVPTVDFSALFADYNPSFGLSGAAPSVKNTAGLTRADLEKELKEARLEGMMATIAMGDVLFPSRSNISLPPDVVVGGAGRDEGGSEGKGHVDVYAALTFVSLCIAMRYRGDGLSEVHQAAASPGNEAKDSSPSKKAAAQLPPAVRFFGLRGIAEAVTDIQKQEATIAPGNLLKQVQIPLFFFPLFFHCRSWV